MEEGFVEERVGDGCAEVAAEPVPNIAMHLLAVEQLTIVFAVCRGEGFKIDSRLFAHIMADAVRACRIEGEYAVEIKENSFHGIAAFRHGVYHEKGGEVIPFVFL